MSKKAIIIMLILFTAINATDTLEGIYFKESLGQIEKETQVDVRIADCQIQEFSEVKDFAVSIKIKYSGAYLNQQRDMIVTSDETESQIKEKIIESALKSAIEKAAQIDHIKKYGTEPEKIETENFFRYIKATYEEEKCVQIKTNIAELLKPQIGKGPKNNSQSNIFQKINGSEIAIISKNGTLIKDIISEQNQTFFTQKEFVSGSLVIENWEAVGIIDNDGRRVLGKNEIEKIIAKEQIKNTEKNQDKKIKEALIEISGQKGKPEEILAKVSEGIFDSNVDLKEEITKKFKKEDNLLPIGILIVLILGIGIAAIKMRKKK